MGRCDAPHCKPARPAFFSFSRPLLNRLEHDIDGGGQTH